MFAFKIFRNYDDNGAGFGDMSLRATSADQGKLSIYAARRAADRTVTLVVINKTFGDLRSDLELHHLKAKGPARVYQYSGVDLTGIRALPAVKASSSGKTGNAAVLKGQLFPAMSITFFAIHEK